MDVLSVYGNHRERVLVEMSMDEARDLIDAGDLSMAGPARVAAATEREIGRLRLLDEDLADSALAASALAMALEIEHPFNSATSKSMCQARLAEAMDRLRELRPPEEKKGRLHDIKSARAGQLRLAQGGSAAAN